MDLDRVHINPITPDRSAAGRYGSRDERSPSDGDGREDAQERRQDRIEISAKGRRTLQDNAVAPDIDFARKALGRLPSASPQRTLQLNERIESGYYTTRGVIDQVVAHLVNAS